MNNNIKTLYDMLKNMNIHVLKIDLRNRYGISAPSIQLNLVFHMMHTLTIFIYICIFGVSFELRQIYCKLTFFYSDETININMMQIPLCMEHK